MPLAVALVGLLKFLPRDYWPPVLRSPLEVRSSPLYLAWPPLDLAWPPLDLVLPSLEMVWRGVSLGGFVIGFIALLPLLLRLLPTLIL